MRVLIAGSHGLIGSALMRQLQQEGHQVDRLSRYQGVAPPPPTTGTVLWNPDRDALDSSHLEGYDAVVNMAGASLFSLWTTQKKKALRDSRLRSTRLLADAIHMLKQPPKVFLCGSAVGFYGDRGATELSEESPAGMDFLAELCVDWEQAATRVDRSEVRVVNSRTGIVLTRQGGALKIMEYVLKLGWGATFGKGDSYMSWISLEDAARALVYLLVDSKLEGPVNLVSPHAVTQKQLVKAVASKLRRPAWLRIPKAPVERMLGDMRALLASQNARPAALQNAGFKWHQPDLESLLDSEWRT